MANAVVKWYGDAVDKFVNRRAQQGIEAVAYEVRERARRNLETNGQIDTKFLYNSIYVSTPSGTSPIPPPGEYRSLKTGDIVRRELGPVMEVNRGAAVGAAAAYALFPELEQSYLYEALQSVQGTDAERLMAGFVQD